MEIITSMKEMGYVGGNVRIDHCLNQTAADEMTKLISGEFPNADIRVAPTGGLCSFYAEKGGLMVGFEKF